MSGGNVQPSIDQAEHVGSNTGDNIEAKRTANYLFDGTNWQREPVPFVDVAYDYQSFSNADANGNYQTITYKTGGSSGATVRTLSLTYDVNNNVTSIARS